MKRALCLAAVLPLIVLTAHGDELFSRQFSESPSELPALPENRLNLWEPLKGETITLIGGTEAVEAGQQGFLEASLQSAFPDADLRVRNLGWHGDTVFAQQRPLFFFTEVGDTRPGSVPDQRQRIEAGTCFLFFGKMEALESTPEEFKVACERFVDDLLTVTPRIFLVSPTDFEAVGPAAALAEERNRTLATIRVMMRKIAGPRGIGFLDARLPAAPDTPHTREGVHLTPSGHARRAESILALLGQQTPREISPKLLAEIATKERLWDQYYRPTNWAFLFGDRQNVPSSRDHDDDEQRWFVREIKALEPLILKADQSIHDLIRR